MKFGKYIDEILNSKHAKGKVCKMHRTADRIVFECACRNPFLAITDISCKKEYQSLFAILGVSMLMCESRKLVRKNSKIL